MLASLLVVLVGGAWLFTAQEHRLKRQAEDDLTAIARFKTGQIENWTHERLADASTISESPAFLQSVERFLKEDDPAEAHDLRQRFLRLRDHYQYSDVGLFDASGRIRLQLGQDYGLGSELTQAMERARSEGRPMVTDIHAAAGDGDRHFDVVAPLFAGEALASPFLGWVALRTSASQYLFPLLAVWPTRSRTAETLLVRREGDAAVFLNDVRKQPGESLALRISLDETDVLAVQALLGARGLLHGLDYRHAKVLGVVMPVPGTPWIMIAKMDSDEVYAAWREQALYIVALLGCLMAGGVAVAFLVRQQQLRLHFQTLYETEAKLRDSLELQAVTLRSIGDAVIATDATGRVTLFNAVAERLTGWSAAEAAGRPLGEVFRIIHELTRAAQESPLARVLAEGAPVELAEHTLLVAKDGVERPIADSAAPIRDVQGAVVGVVLIFRDNSAERRMRLAKLALGASEAKYRELVESAHSIILKMDTEGRVTFFNEYAQVFFGYAADEILGQHVVGTIVPETDTESRVMADLIQGVLDSPDAHPLVENENRRRDDSRVWVRWANKAIRDEAGRVVGVLSVGTDITDLKRAQEELRFSQEDLKRAQAVAMTGSWRLDVADNALSWSDESYRIFGIPAGTPMTYASFLACVHPDDREALDKAWNAALGGERYDIEHRIVVDDVVKWVRERAVLEWDRFGKLRHGFGVVQDITEHKQFERFKAVNEARSTALLELAEMHDLSPEALAEAMLERAVALTESACGYLHLVNDDQVNLQLMHWSSSVRRLCQAEPTRHYPLDEAGLWAECLRTGRPSLQNDYAAASGRKGLPQGHITLVRHLSVPVSEGERYRAVLGVGNKRDPYDDIDVQKLQRFVVDAWQIVSRRRAETALRQSEAFSRAIIENSPDCIKVLNHRGELVFMSQGGQRLLELGDATEVYGKAYLDFWQGSDHERAKAAYEDARAGRIGRFEGFCATRGGTPKWWDVTISPVSGLGGEERSFLVISRDDTQRKQAVDALRESEERFRQLVESAPDAIFVQVDGVFAYVNQASLNLYGLDEPEDLVGTPVLARFHPDFHEAAARRMQSIKERQQPQPPMEQRHLRADGGVLDVEVSAVPLCYGGKQGGMVFVRDIAERKRLETLREDMDRIARHDLKTPLNAILGLPQVMLMDDNLTEEQRQFLHYIMDAGYKMLDLVNLSMDLFRMERGSYELVPVKVDLLRVLGKVLADLERISRSKALVVSLGLDGRPALPGDVCPARGEELLCYSMFSNLIKNALESSPEGGPVSVRIVRDQGWRIDIANLGEVPEELRGRFFEKYATMGKVGGTGLGTYSARLMAATMGGSITLDASRPGATTVSVRLPAMD